MSKPLEIIGLSGRAGTGKDYIFENFLQPLGYWRFAFADHLKISVVGKELASYEEVFHTKPPKVRTLLQQVGTEEGRNVYGKDIWCKTALAWMQHFQKVWGISRFCITDARFPNEVEFIQRNGGRVFRIVAPTRVALSSLSEQAKSHESEIALDDYVDFDGWITNDPSEANTVSEQLAQLFKAG